MAKRLSEDELKYVISAETSAAQKEIHELSKATRVLRTEERHRRQAMIELEAQGKKNTEEYRRLKNEVADYTRKINENINKEDALRRSLDVNVMSMSQLRKQSKDLRRELDGVSKALEPERYAVLEKQLSGVDKRMAELKDSAKTLKELAIAPSSIGSMIGIITIEVAKWVGNALKGMREFVAEGIEMAESADGVRHAFSRLDDGTILNNLRAATKGTVTDLDLMKAVILGNDFRIPMQDMGKYLQFAQLKAQQLGKSVDEMTNSIVTGLGRKSVMILDNLGLSAAEINEEIAKTGDFMSGVANIIDRQLAAAGDRYVSAADKAQAASVRLKNAQMELGAILLPLKEQWDSSFTGLQISLMESLGWIVRHRQAVFTLVAAYTAYRTALSLSTTATYNDMVASKASIIIHKLKALTMGNLRGVSLLYAAAKAKITGNTVRATAAMRAFNTACKSNLIGIIAASAVAAGMAIYGMYKRNQELSLSMQSLNRIQKNASIRFEEQASRVRMLSEVVHNANLSYNERKKALDELQEIVPEYMATLDREGGLINENKAALDNYLRSLERTTRFEAAKEELVEIYRKQIQLKRQLREEEEAFEKSKVKLAGARFSASQRASAAGTSGTRTLMSGIDQGVLSAETDLALADKAIRKTKAELAELDTAISTINKEISGSITTTRTETGAKVDLIEAKKKEIELAEKEIATTREEVAAKNKKIEGLKEELALLQNLGIKKKGADSTKRENKSLETGKLKASVDAEKDAISSLEQLREESLQKQKETYNTFAYAYNADLAEQLITKEEHEMLMLQLENNNAQARLRIEQTFYDDSLSMALTDAELKEEIVRKMNGRVIDAQKEANQKQWDMQSKLGSLIKDFKEQFKITTVDEDLEMQRKTLEAAYQARLDMAKKEGLETTELTRAYNRAKEQLELEHQQRIRSIRDQYGISTDQEKFDAELAQLKNARSQGLLTEEEYEKAGMNMKLSYYKKVFDYYSNLFSDAVASLRQAEMDNIDAQYDAEIEAARGNAEEVERLENEKAQKKLDVEKRYADVQFAVKASQIIANTAMAISTAYAQLGPVAGSIAAALMAVTGAAQLASANAERQKVKNLTLSGSSSSSKSGARVATGRESGGKIDVRRAQDGKLFPNADFDPDARGFIDRPTVIVGEGPTGRSREWVASNAAVENPTVSPILDILDRSQQAGTIRTLDLNRVIRARMAGYSDGGFIHKSSVTSMPAQASTGSPSMPSELMERFARAIIRIDERGIPASVALTDIDRQRDLRDRSRKVGSKA